VGEGEKWEKEGDGFELVRGREKRIKKNTQEGKITKTDKKSEGSARG